jgi:D-xylose transport system ATP-binding protein
VTSHLLQTHIVEDGTDMSADIVVEMRNITKEFPGVVALADVSMAARKGEIHAIVGENGAGKSTLMKVLCGFHPASTFRGEVIIKGKSCRFQSVKDAEQEGIAIIFQELNLAPNLSVAENIYLGKQPRRLGIIDPYKLHVDAQRCLHDIGLTIDPQAKVGDLPIGKRQSVEIAKAISKDAGILILDEPTSSLSESEIEILMGLLAKLRAKGVACIYISHKLNEVFRIADTITVLRDGRLVGTGSKTDLTKSMVISMMVGRSIQDIFPKAGLCSSCGT